MSYKTKRLGKFKYILARVDNNSDYSTRLNDCLKEINHPLPTLEEIFTNLNGRHIFSKLDLSELYQQILEEGKCAELLTINTHRV